MTAVSSLVKRVALGVLAILAGVLTGCVGAPEKKACEIDFTVASFNVRCPCDAGELAWYRRMPRVAEVVRRHGFDVFGVQEAVSHEVAILEAELPDFTYVGCGRDENREGEAMLVFYNRNRFECLENGTFWLSETPDKPGSRYTGAGCPRTCTWALLRDRLTGRRFRYFNTHLDHISSKARWNGMQVLLERGVRPAKARGETVILTGDLNETLDKADTPEAIFALTGAKLAEAAKENPIALVSTELVDAYGKSVTPHQGPHKTFHGWKGTPRCRIDYIFVTPDVKVLSHATLDDRPEGRFASDHYPVAARIRIGEGCRTDAGAKAAGAEPHISVFAKFIRQVSKERGVSLAKAAEMLYGLGVRGYDCGPDEEDLDALAATCLKPINFYYFPDWFGRKLHDWDTYYADRATPEECLVKAKKYGIPRIMVVPPSFTDGKENEAEFAKIVARMKVFVAAANKEGIDVTIETFGGTGNCCSYSKYLKRLLTEIPALKFALDTGNLYYAGRGEDVLELMAFAKGRIGHVHLKDQSATNNREYVTLGLGAVPNEKVVRAVAATDYDGWYTLENPVGDTYNDTVRQTSLLKDWLK